MTAAFADGRVLQYHVTSGNLVSTVPSPEKDFQLNNIAYSADGSRFATGGSDSYVRVYDEVSKKLICSLYAGWVVIYISLDLINLINKILQ